MRDLINMVLEATGCDLKINEHDIEDQDNVTGRLSDLQDEYQAVCLPTIYLHDPMLTWRVQSSKKSPTTLSYLGLEAALRSDRL